MPATRSPAEPEDLLRAHGLRVTRPRLAVLAALAGSPHAGADAVVHGLDPDAGPVSTQAVYDVLNVLTDRGIVRRIRPAGSAARYELRVGDNHHHVVCRDCGAVADVACATGSAPCLETTDLHLHSPGFAVDEAEVTFWGRCAACRTGTSDPTS